VRWRRSRAGGPRFVLALILVACKRLHRRFSNNNQRKDAPSSQGDEA
jgi:hypothetical protein